MKIEPIERGCSIGSAVICRFIIFGSTLNTYTNTYIPHVFGGFLSAVIFQTVNPCTVYQDSLILSFLLSCNCCHSA